VLADTASRGQNGPARPSERCSVAQRTALTVMPVLWSMAISCSTNTGRLSRPTAGPTCEAVDKMHEAAHDRHDMHDRHDRHDTHGAHISVLC
jgi:hypothetical protein